MITSDLVISRLCNVVASFRSEKLLLMRISGDARRLSAPLPPHLYYRMEEDSKNCKRRAGQEVDVK